MFFILLDTKIQGHDTDTGFITHHNLVIHMLISPYATYVAKYPPPPKKTLLF